MLLASDLRPDTLGELKSSARPGAAGGDDGKDKGDEGKTVGEGKEMEKNKEKSELL